MRQGHVAITGASSGLGAALALAYAGECNRLSLAGRDGARLAASVETCRSRGCGVQGEVFDIQDHEHLRRWLARIDQDSPLNLVIANAGVSTGIYGGNLETLAAVEEVMAVDATATMATVSLAAEIMVKHGKGAIAVVSSLAGLLPLASSPAYCAAKSAARMHALALRSWLRSRGVNVTVVCPGYVATPMSDRVIGSKPFLWSADKAAEYIRRKLASAPREIRFPFPLAVGIRALGLLPHRLQSAILRHFTFTVEPHTTSPEQDNADGMR